MTIDGRTYCGRDATKVTCIDPRKDVIDTAECRVCQASDDRRTCESYRKSDDYKAAQAAEKNS